MQQAKGDCPDRVHSDGGRLDLMRGGHKCSRVSWKTRGLVRISHSDSLKKGQLTLSQGKMKEGDDVAVDEDNDEKNL